MNYADIKTVDVQDGTGVRVSLYVSGCHFHCKGCHNKEAWDFDYGKEYNEETEKYILDLLDRDYISGLSILGGEPLEPSNQKVLAELVEKVKDRFPNKTIWCYTGYDFEKNVLGEMYKKFDYTPKFLQNVDVIVDGQFEEEKKLVDLKFRGSYNQRKIDVQQSLKNQGVIQLKFGDEERYETLT
ncbi:MAG: anaerobic ribonucleoside-triphosphate reductase activating protein [Clostridia bacterium]|nr:anaerobic ribonucleoside-triphosphate reductase activating protein [Clostridia bacterium]